MTTWYMGITDDPDGNRELVETKEFDNVLAFKEHAFDAITGDGTTRKITYSKTAIYERFHVEPEGDEAYYVFIFGSAFQREEHRQ